MYNEYTFEEIDIGQKADFSVEITAEMMDQFRKISGDVNPLHNDKEYAVSMGYRDRVVYGMLTASFISTMAGVYLPGKYSLINREEMSFLKPVIVGDVLTVKGEVVAKNTKYCFITVKIVIVNQDNVRVGFGKVETGVTK